MNKKKKIVLGTFVAFCLIWGGIDYWGATTGDSLSEMVRDLATKSTLFIFLCGAVIGTFIGHLFWYQEVGSGDTGGSESEETP